MTGGWAALALVAALGTADAHQPPARPSSLAASRTTPALRHATHLSTLRLVVEGRSLTGRIRLFRDDLEAVLRKQARSDTLSLREGALAEALMTRYLASALVVTGSSDGPAASFRVTAAGLERDLVSKQDVVWYVIEASLPTAPRLLDLQNRLLADEFEDQQNIVTVLRLPEDERTTLYFTGTARRAQSLRW